MKPFFKILLELIIASGWLTACRETSPVRHDPGPKAWVDYVNPLMGTASAYEFSHGNVYPAVARPWGMDLWTPQTGDMNNHWIYQYGAGKIQGIRHTHEPSPWMGDYGAFSVMAATGPLKINGEERASSFDHGHETSTPYYYKVELNDYHIVAEVTATERCAIIRFTFPSSDQSQILFDAFDMGSGIRYHPADNRFDGYVMNNSGGVPKGFRQYFSGRLSKRPSGYGCWNNDRIVDHDSVKDGDHVGAYFQFNTSAGETIEVRIGTSFISSAQAERNLKSEIGDRTFQEISDEGKKVWETHLGRISVEGGTEDQKKVFYTCLYRALLFPNEFYEYDSLGSMIHYSPFDGKVHPGPMFTNDGFWDTFRAVFPLYTLIFPDRDGLMLKGFLNAYDEGGWFPIWPSPGYRKVMIGSHGASLLADAMVKGVHGFDSLKAFRAVVKDATVKAPDYAPGRDGMEYYNRLGYCPYPEIRESTAKTLEYAYDDFCIRQMALLLDKKKEANLFGQRALNYRNVFDPSRLLMQGRKKDGSFLRNFSPFAWGGPFTEGNAWHYTWSVFQDPQGLINLMGGEDTFIKMMDSVFLMPPMFDKGTYPVVIHEISEMVKAGMGQYAHGNEPIQHMIYFYDYAGQPWKTQSHVREIMDRLYNPGPEGYCGDEDTGQTSAWYVFSAMGFYPVCPGVPQYVLGGPLFNRITIHLENGKDFVIQAQENSTSNRYIKSASLNHTPYHKTWLAHEEILKGGELTLSIDSVPNKKWGTYPEDRPYSLSLETVKP